jgi:hypothetical protein
MIAASCASGLDTASATKKHRTVRQKGLILVCVHIPRNNPTAGGAAWSEGVGTQPPRVAAHIAVAAPIKNLVQRMLQEGALSRRQTSKNK